MPSCFFQVLGGFKKGAFSVAVKAGVPVVPITLVGTGGWVWGGGGVCWRGRGGGVGSPGAAGPGLTGLKQPAIPFFGGGGVEGGLSRREFL